ncbi:MAG: Hsp20/alpha crystallin family protein, partial [Verrucomicrobia bacterium]|nr:Hsp20/alpha crystallin family protein [Verrucomicrobiota bacterium]
MQKKDEKKKGEQEDNLDIDLGVGKISLGGMFKGLERLVDLASKLKEAGGEMNKEGEVDLGHLKKGMKAVYGFTVKSAVGGKPVVEPFGNVKQTPKGPTVDEE